MNSHKCAKASTTPFRNNEESAVPPSREKRQQWAIALFSICTILLFADQNLMAPNLTAIANDFGFDASERDRKLGGQISLAFFVLGAPASFVVGCLGDTYDRTRLFAMTVGIGEGACLATYFCQTFAQFYVCRAVTGFSIGGALPLIYSVLGDMYAADERHKVIALVGIGSALGVSIGQGIAGFVGPTWGWRLPFIIVSLPALVCAALVYLTVEDPERGCMEEAFLEHRDYLERNTDKHEDTEQTYLQYTPIDCDDGDDIDNAPLETNGPKLDLRECWKNFVLVISTPTVLLASLQAAPGCVPWGIVNAYLNDFLSQNRGMSVEYATFAVLVFGIGSFLGMMLSGIAGGYLYRIDKRYPLILSGSTAIIGCIPFLLLLNYVDHSTPFLVSTNLAFIAGVAVSTTGPIVKATVQNVTLPRTRGQAFAIFNLFDDFGRGLGPVFVALLIQRFGGRTPAFNVGVIGWLVCGLLNFGMMVSVVRDERSVQHTLATSLRRQQSSHVVENGASHEGLLVDSDPLS